MIVKTVGALMTGIACAYIGTRKSFCMKKRHQNLTSMKKSLDLLETKIEFAQSDIKIAFEEISKESGMEKFFKYVVKHIDKIGAAAAWKKAVHDLGDLYCFGEEDKNTVGSLALRLGMTDVENQRKNIEYVKNMLDLHIKSAAYDMEKFCRLYSGGGVLAGIFLIMMFL